ncbi:MAG TPA: translation elongation factor 4 [Patescibacteria group bacterium]|jgi:GTP-binding protein LepA|nr:translation elongation factor 4 [Patescibacteria group bacterium]
MQAKPIRNFCIIAHIDHGKSTLADRLLELTGTVEMRNMKAQLLDQMDLERERGITIKLAPVRMAYHGVELNLIDTPGHVDFSYEVSRSLEACEGAVLVVDATQGIQAQTLANVYLALAANLTIIPVINKIDLAVADVDKTTDEIMNLLGCSKQDILLISAKTGIGVEAVLERVISEVPPPSGQPDAPLRALIFDSYYDEYRGVITYVRVVDGRVASGDSLLMMSAQASTIALELGSLNPGFVPRTSLEAGEIGYIVTNLRTSREAKVGDTVTSKKVPATQTLPGYIDIHPFVYAGFFPSSNEHYLLLKDAIEKLSLSDSALQFTPENSPVLGHGFRVGFLGLLHLDIVHERLEREYGLDLIVTNPSTDYEIKLSSGSELTIQSAADLPDPSTIEQIKEPWIKGEIVCPKEFVGQVIQLVVTRRGLQKNIHYVDNQLAVIDFEAPLSNLLTDFYDALKSSTSGYGSFNYELADYRPGDLVRVDFYIAGEIMEALSVIVHRSESQQIGREIVSKLKDIIPRQQFQVSLQAAIGGKFIAREDVSAYRKDVTGYLYGGDVSRKKKLLAKQKKGKQKMKRIGKIDMPADAFTVMLKR